MMDPTITGVVEILTIFKSVGGTIIWLIDLAKNRAKDDQRKRIDEKLDEVLDKLLSGNMTITLELDEPLMDLLRQMTATPEMPHAEWVQSTRGLIRGRETEFETLTELHISQEAIGVEALTNHVNWDYYAGMMNTVAAYLALPEPQVSTDSLQDSTLSRALAKRVFEAQSPLSLEEMQKRFGPTKLRFNDPHP